MKNIKKEHFLVIVIIAFIIGGGVGFFVGNSSSTSTMKGGMDSGFSAKGGSMNRGQGGMSMRGGGFVSGEVLSVDTNSMVVKMRDGSSKIVLYSPSTEISKFASGLISDVSTGKQVMINGTTNSDGSVTATSVQIRPTTLSR